MTTSSIFASLDLWVVGYAAGMALVASGLTIWRARNAQRLQGLLPLTHFGGAIPDTLTGMVVGTFLGVLGPGIWKTLDNLTGISLLAGLGGIVGPKLWDLLSSKGLGIALNAIPGPIGKALAAANTPPAPVPVPEKEKTDDRVHEINPKKPD